MSASGGSEMNSWNAQEVAHSKKWICRASPRIALLTPYTGGNLGDAAIQDAVIVNLQRLMPSAQFSGITLNCSNFLERHGTSAFPLVGAGTSFFRMDEKWTPPVSTVGGYTKGSILRQVLRRVPGAKLIKGLLQAIQSRSQALKIEARHWMKGYQFLRRHDLLLFSGGGQLDDNYGGPMGLPFALLKWTILARLAEVPCVMGSVGVGIINSRVSRCLIAIALRLSLYRSFREERSRAAAARMYWPAQNDPVMPDFALTLSDAELPEASSDVRTMAAGRPILVLSPMAFAKPTNWPAPDRALHERYVKEIAAVLESLFHLGYFVVIACSSRGDDESVIPHLLGHLTEESRRDLDQWLLLPRIESWKELLSVLKASDFLIASRLHGGIFGFVTEIPVISISFASKVDWVLEFLGLSDYRLDIRTFEASDVMALLERIKVEKERLHWKLASRRSEILSDVATEKQFAQFANFALWHFQFRG